MTDFNDENGETSTGSYMPRRASHEPPSIPSATSKRIQSMHKSSSADSVVSGNMNSSPDSPRKSIARDRDSNRYSRRRTSVT
ncbi:hypothetical protein HDU76_012206, partial [Blyttiomyces sp. JEL0837]